MSAKIPLIVIYQIGDGYTFTATDVVPVMAESKQAFLSDFELAMAAYAPDGVEHFSICGQLFEYRHFIEWTTEKTTPRRTRDTYEAYAPEVFTVDEWVARSLESSNRFASTRAVNVVAGGRVETPAQAAL
jgi:hypothetical protein